ncbi:MAG: hypothetical protein ACRDN0_21425 [Trebonia sp.]
MIGIAFLIPLDSWQQIVAATGVLGLIAYAYQQWRSGEGWRDAGLGAWLVVYLALVLVVSAIGSPDFGGTGAIPAPWDTVAVAVIGLGAWAAGVRNGLLHLAEHPAPAPQGQHQENQEKQQSPGIVPDNGF